MRLKPTHPAFLVAAFIVLVATLFSPATHAQTRTGFPTLTDAIPLPLDQLQRFPSVLENSTFKSPDQFVSFNLPIIQPKSLDDPVDPAKVNKAIERAIQFLQNDQLGNGTWRSGRFRPEASTAICTLALLNAGIKPTEPKLSLAIEKLIDTDINRMGNAKTYFVSLRIMVLATADPEGAKYIVQIKDDVNWLLKHIVGSGGWSYGLTTSGRGDGSNTQFALLALHAATEVGKEVGIKIPREQWLKMRGYWEKSFDPKSGGFAYTPSPSGASASMTCAGISSLIIINEKLADPLQEVNGDLAQCCQPNQQ